MMNREHITLSDIRNDVVKTVSAIRVNRIIMNVINKDFALGLLLHKASSEFDAGNYERASEHLENLIKKF